jgi:hypothetical protein
MEAIKLGVISFKSLSQRLELVRDLGGGGTLVGPTHGHGILSSRKHTHAASRPWRASARDKTPTADSRSALPKRHLICQ